MNPKLKDCRSDIYSVGAIWYFILCGQAPIGIDVLELLDKNANLSVEQRNIIVKCLSSNLEDRYENVEALMITIDNL